MGDERIRHLAVDLGANGGTAVAGRFDGGELALTDVHRFDNRPEPRDGRYVWDVDRLRDEIATAVRTAAVGGARVDSVGIDAWGTDFGLFRDEALVASPYAYRDPRLTETRDRVLEAVTRREIFEHTGLTHWDATSTLWQYHYLATEDPERLDGADRIQLMPQVLSTLLGADPYCEPTIASTTQLLDPRTRDWAGGLLETLGLPTDPLPTVRPAERIVGDLATDVVDPPPDLVVPASHDTAAAVAALPLGPDSRAFLSTGTWFVVGFELDEPVLSGAAFEAGASNELGVEDTVRLLRNVDGFFLLEACREAWRTDGGPPGYDELLDAMRRTEPFGPLVDPDDPAFGIGAEMPAAIRSYCRRTDQQAPQSRGEIVRCILESLAAKTAVVLEKLSAVVDAPSDVLHVGGGGVRNEPFCELLAGATGRTVVAGPAEATAVGNLLGQARAYDEVSDLREGRRLVEQSVQLETYAAPVESEWDDARARMRALLEGPATD